MRRHIHTVTLVLSSLGGAVGSVMAAVLISFALLDIYFEGWPREFYAVIYFALSLMCFLSDYQGVTPKHFSRTVGVLCFLASGVSASIGTILVMGGFFARVLSLTFLGLVLGLTLVLSILLLAWTCNELRKDCCSPKGPNARDVLPREDDNTATLRVLWLCVTAVSEGLFFGLVTGLLEHDKYKKHERPHVFELPNAQPKVVLPVAALLGAVAGFQLERIRQDSLNLYAALENDGEFEGSVLDDTLLFDEDKMPGNFKHGLLDLES